MTRILLAAALAAGALLTTSPASACELQYCSWAKPVCDRIDCAHPVCFETPEIVIC